MSLIIIVGFKIFFWGGEGFGVGGNGVWGCIFGVRFVKFIVEFWGVDGDVLVCGIIVFVGIIFGWVGLRVENVCCWGIG